MNHSSDAPEYVPDVQVFFEGYQTNCSHGTGDKKTHYISITPTLLRPRNTGTVTLRSPNPQDPPKIKANYLKNEDDLKTLIEGIR